VKQRKRTTLAFSLLLTASACHEALAPAPSMETNARDFLALATQVEAPLEDALADFDTASARRDSPACRAAARRAVEAARAARDQIEKSAVSEGLVAARREELTYLNHVVPGFQSFLEGDAGSAEIGKVRSILARGRSHQSRARAALRDAAASR
jgi:hypothetical protein